MPEGMQQKDALGIATQAITDKRSRSAFFLVLSFIIILGINSMLPLIEGGTHFTVEAVDMTYGEYETLKDTDPRYKLSWLSLEEVAVYKARYTAGHPEIPIEESFFVEVPDTFQVRVFTKFFFQYPFWYISTALSLGSAVLLFYSFFNYLHVRALDKNPEYLEEKKEVDLMKKTALDPTTFEPWISKHFNYTRKISQHRANVNYDLAFLDRKTKPDVRDATKDYDKAILAIAERKFIDTTLDDERKQKIIEESKRSLFDSLPKKVRRYINCRKDLHERLTPEYIEQYVSNGKVKYFKYIHPMFVYNGTNVVTRAVDSYSMIQGDGSRLISDAGRKILLSLVVTLVFAVLLTVTAVGSLDQSPFWIAINVVTKIAPLLLQIPMAIDYCDTFMKEQVIANTISRKTIGLLYLADLKKGITY